MVLGTYRAISWLLLLALAALEPQRRFTDLALDPWTATDGLPQNAVLALGQETRASGLAPPRACGGWSARPLRKR